MIRLLELGDVQQTAVTVSYSAGLASI